MTATELHKWCAAKRGRLSELARALELSRQSVWQWTTGDRPIPAEQLPLVRHEMKRAERMDCEKAAG